MDPELVLIDYFDGKPAKLAIILAHRAALRILPQLGQHLISDDFRDTFRSDLARSFLYCSIASRCAMIDHTKPRKIAAFHAYRIASHHLAAATAFAQAAAACTAKTDADAVSLAIDAVLAADDYNDDVWSSVVHDMSLLADTEVAQDLYDKAVQDGSAPHTDDMDKLRDFLITIIAEKLLERPLWGRGCSSYQDDWNKLRDFLLTDDTNWQFWVDFYQTLLQGGAHSPDYIDLMDRVAQLPVEDWQRPAQEINAIISDLYREYLNTTDRQGE